MRIIAGAAKGIPLAAAGHATRPMTGRARESLFSILGARCCDATVLDLYAGTGSLGLEALSRGAADALFVERDRVAARRLKDNIDAVGLGGVVRIGPVERVLTHLEQSFDLVFVDPPYANDDASITDIVGSLRSVVVPGGLVVVHRRSRRGFDIPEFLTCIDQRRYGDAVVTMMERLES